jgi:hypothetical protein
MAERRKRAVLRAMAEDLLVVDTVVLYFPHPFVQPHEDWIGHGIEVGGQKHVDRWTYNSGTLRLTLKHLGPQATLFVEASLPKLLWGHNITLLTLGDFIRASGELHRLVTAATPHHDAPPLEEWSLSRVDFCHAWGGVEAARYISSIGPTLDCTARQVTVHYHNPSLGGDTLERRSGRSWTELLYNKAAETHHALRSMRPKPDEEARKALLGLAEGVLRYEVQMGRKALKKHLGEAPTFGDLSLHLATQGNTLIRARWEHFTKDWMPMDHETVRGKLLERYSDQPAVAKRLFCTWLAVNTMGRNEFASAFRISRDTMRRDFDQMEQAGVFVGTGAGLEPLAVLDPQ